MFKLILGVILPFLGTCLGAFFVFFLRNKFNAKVNKILSGFAAGVMLASSIWSLIIPAIEQSAYLDYLMFFPALCGICLGVFFMLLLDKICFKLSNKSKKNSFNLNQKNKLLFWAVTIHNIPEGMAVGVALTSAYFGEFGISIASALVLSAGIAIQNIPEGAIVSMPMLSDGYSKIKAFGIGVFSGVVEPIFALISMLLINIVSPILPYFLAFAAGSMIYVVIEELVPEAHETGAKAATISFIIGFLIMMILDVVLG